MVHLRVEQLVLHEQPPTLACSRWCSSSRASGARLFQPRLARGQELVTPLGGPRRRDPQFPRHRLEILASQQAEYRRAFTPGENRPFRSRSAAGLVALRALSAAVDSSTCFLISTLLLRELSRNQVSKKTLGRRRSASRKRDVVLRLLRGESLEALSREVGVEIYRLDAWRERAMAGLELGLKDRHGEPVAEVLDAAKRHIGELSMEIELLRERARAAEQRLPLAMRRSRR